MTAAPAAGLDVRDAVEGLLASYAALIDAGDFTGIGELLADTVVTMEDGTVVATGARQIARLYENTTRRFANGTPNTSHVITNLVVAPLDGDRPAGAPRYVARSTYTVFQATPEVALQPIVSGRYRDVVEQRVDGSWHFVERAMILRLFGDLHDHMLFDPSTLS